MQSLTFSVSSHAAGSCSHLQLLLQGRAMAYESSHPATATPPAHQSSCSWPRLMQLCYRQFPHTPRQCLWLNHPWSLLLCGTSSQEAQSMCHTFYSAWAKIPMEAYLASPYFNACSECPWGSTPFSCFTQSVLACWRSRGGKKIEMQLWKLSVRSLTIWWKHFSLLVCIQACLFHSNAGTNGSSSCWWSIAAELILIRGPKGWAQKHKGLPTERTQNAPSELQLSRKESLSMISPHSSGSCITWLLCYQNTCI